MTIIKKTKKTERNERNMRFMFPVREGEDSVREKIISIADEEGTTIQRAMENLVEEAIETDWNESHTEYEEVQCRLSEEQRDGLKDINKKTGLTYGEIIIKVLRQF